MQTAHRCEPDILVIFLKGLKIETFEVVSVIADPDHVWKVVDYIFSDLGVFMEAPFLEMRGNKRVTLYVFWIWAIWVLFFSRVDSS